MLSCRVGDLVFNGTLNSIKVIGITQWFQLRAEIFYDYGINGFVAFI